MSCTCLSRSLGKFVTAREVLVMPVMPVLPMVPVLRSTLALRLRASALSLDL